jgi:hypothetical protein
MIIKVTDLTLETERERWLQESNTKKSRVHNVNSCILQNIQVMTRRDQL